MSEWNLSVRLTGQGSDLARTLRTTARDARAASRDVNALRRDIGRLRNEARTPIRLRIRLDTRNLRADVRRALNTADTGRGLAVNLRLADPAQLRRDVSAAVRAASRTQTVTVRVTPDTSALNGLNNTVNAPAAGSTASSSSGALKSLLLLSPAVIPLTTALATLPGILAASGTAATAFGIAVAGQIGPLSEVTEAEQKYQEAVREHGSGSAEAAKAQLDYQKQLAALPPAAQQGAAALTNLKDAYRQWSDGLSGDTTQPVIHSMALMEQLLPHLTPQVKSMSREMDRAITLMSGAVATPGFDAASDKFADFTDRTLDRMGDKLVHVMRMLSEGKASGPLAGIVDYINAHGDEARETLGNLADAVGNLFEGAAEAGPIMMTLVNAVARLVSALPPELVGILIQVAAGLKLIQLAGAGMAAVAGGIATLGTRIGALRAAFTAAGGGMAGFSAAFGTLPTAARFGILAAGIVGVAMGIDKLAEISRGAPPDVDRLATSIKGLSTSGKFSGELKTTFRDMDGFVAKIRLMDQAAKDADTVKPFLDLIPGGPIVEKLSGKVDDLVNGTKSLAATKEDFKAFDEAFAVLAKGGHAKVAADEFEKFDAALRASGKSTEEIKALFPEYTSALADAKFEAELVAQSMGIFGQAAADTSAQLEAQKGAADGLRASLIALNETNRSAHDAQTQFEKSLDDLTASFKEHGATLNADTEAGRANRDAMSAASKAQDELIVSGVAAGESFKSMTGKSQELRGEMMRLATQAFGGNKKAATEYVNTLLGTPEFVQSTIRLEKAEAERGLWDVQAAIEATPDAHTVTVDTLNAAAIAALEAVGLKTRQLPDGKTEVYTANGQSLGSIGAVLTALANLDGRTANTYTNHHVTTTKTTIFKSVQAAGGSNQAAKNMAETEGRANGAVVDYYANGGIQRGGLRSFAGGAENHVAQFARAGSWRMWAEPETGGEAYIPLAMSKRVRSRAIAEETVRRLGGDPKAIQWNADGNVTDWRYDPQTGSLYSASDAGQAGHKTRKVKVKGKGGKVTIKEIEYFDLKAVENRIKSTAKATQAWNKDLEKVADRVGGDVAEALAAMGKDGMKLADKMANGSTKYINEMAAALRNLQKTAKASLTDYTRQLTSANTMNKKFADDLAKLAGMGYGDLAAQLAAQGDEAAQQLAAAAAKDKKKAAKANAAAKTANAALTSEEVATLVQIIAAVKNSKTGIHDVAGTTGLGEDEIIAVANKARGQIKSSLGSRSDRFLADLKNANAGKAYANGGIRAGMYATRAGIIRFAEPETGGEAFLPLGQGKRRHALPVLADVAHRFGMGLTDARAGRPVVIVRSGDTITVPVTTTGQNATASDIGAQVGYQFRRAKRGGVSSRAA
ncbi:hypothetical protein [Streptomyces sp. AS02]|uniref:hypothetical protein n=1 Tax=Streptomyces sp. AS02 TaxID=2938946 RepID=UPI002020ECED|nr:hypothetical protein [Streptomyces sp. AS02]MCL8016967.1 hypothetical protein [Streptomyces sp. AS02]